MQWSEPAFSLYRICINFLLLCVCDGWVWLMATLAPRIIIRLLGCSWMSTDFPNRCQDCKCKLNRWYVVVFIHNRIVSDCAHGTSTNWRGGIIWRGWINIFSESFTRDIYALLWMPQTENYLSILKGLLGEKKMFIFAIYSLVAFMIWYVIIFLLTTLLY